MVQQLAVAVWVHLTPAQDIAYMGYFGLMYQLLVADK